jgi:hypothetical protein
MFRQIASVVALALVLTIHSFGQAQTEVVKLSPTPASHKELKKSRLPSFSIQHAVLDLITVSKQVTFSFKTHCKELVYASDGSGVATARLRFYIRFHSRDRKIDSFAEGYQTHEVNDREISGMKCGFVSVSRSVDLPPGEYQVDALLSDVLTGARWHKSLFFINPNK